MLTSRTTWSAKFFSRRGPALAFFALSFGGTFSSTLGPTLAQAETPTEPSLVILSTNDIHGAITGANGGLAAWATEVQRIRQQNGADRVLLLDAGDQFQGTLLSNYSEGRLLFDVFQKIGYDAVIPGNHDYDFGPLGWLVDQLGMNSTPVVPPGRPGDHWGWAGSGRIIDEQTAAFHPRGAFLRLAERVSFPMLSANTFYRDSFFDIDGQQIDVLPSRCSPVNSDPHRPVRVIDRSRLARPSFLAPYTIVEKSGLRVAIVGIDHEMTPTMTTAAAVSDLCFESPEETLLEVRRELQGRADIFIVLMHNGDADRNVEGSDLLHRVNVTWSAAGGVEIPYHAVISGHTHVIYNKNVDGAPFVQSGSSLRGYGRVELFWDANSNRVRTELSRSQAGLAIASPQDPEIRALVEDESSAVQSMADRSLGIAHAAIRVDRTLESPLANWLTDELRWFSGAQVSLMNTGGIRAPFAPGPIRYEDLYRTVPFNNHAVISQEFPVRVLIDLLEKSISSCGEFGALMQSGLRVRFSRDCKGHEGRVDPGASLLSVELLATRAGTPGLREVLYDRNRGGLVVDPDRRLTVATLDFLALGGSAYSAFTQVDFGTFSDLGIYRERAFDFATADGYQVELVDTVDGRWSAEIPIK